MSIKKLLLYSSGLLLLFLLGACSSSLLYTKNKQEHMDLKVLEQYAANPQDSPFSRSTQYGNKDQSTVSYILTSKTEDSVKIVVQRKKGVYTNIMHMEYVDGQYVVSNFDATGKLTQRRVVEAVN